MSELLKLKFLHTFGNPFKTILMRITERLRDAISVQPVISEEAKHILASPTGALQLFKIIERVSDLQADVNNASKESVVTVNKEEYVIEKA